MHKGNTLTEAGGRMGQRNKRRFEEAEKRERKWLLSIVRGWGGGQKSGQNQLKKKSSSAGGQLNGTQGAGRG